MIKHVVLFKFKAFENEEDKFEKLIEIKEALEALTDHIPELKSMEVGLNANDNESFDLALLSTFESMTDMEQYAKHPAHMAVSAMIGLLKEDRACVDYIF